MTNQHSTTLSKRRRLGLAAILFGIALALCHRWSQSGAVTDPESRHLAGLILGVLAPASLVAGVIFLGIRGSGDE